VKLHVALVTVKASRAAERAAGPKRGKQPGAPGSAHAGGRGFEVVGQSPGILHENLLEMNHQFLHRGPSSVASVEAEQRVWDDGSLSTLMPHSSRSAS
jgi:hypothetical protein